MGLTEATYVTQPQQSDLLFSVCTLVASDEKYERMRKSFARFGFTSENSEYLAVDNRTGNNLDGYEALRATAPRCRGQYILYTHDDIELVSDGAPELTRVLEDLERDDPRWTVAGNAGWTEDGKTLVRHLEDPHGRSRDVTKPVRTMSLDENFLVLPRARLVLPSLDLKGFHLFATDLCIQSRFAGGAAYVIPFFLKHWSGGSSSAAYDQARADFEAKYAKRPIGRSLSTPAGPLYFGPLGRLQKQAEDFCARTISFARRATAKLVKLAVRPADTGEKPNETSRPRG